MVDNSTRPNHSSSCQGNNILSTIQTPILEVGGYSQPGPKFSYEVTYEKLYAFWPITRQFAKPIALIPIAHNIPHHPKKKEITPTGVLAASEEYLAFSMHEELAESSKDKVQQEPLPTIHEEYTDDIVLSNGEQQTVESEFNNNLNCEGEVSPDSETKEELRDEDVEDKYLDWMA